MQITGEWHLESDGVERPSIRGEVRTTNGSWVETSFLVDTGADCTALCAPTLELLGLPRGLSPDQLGGLGGLAAAVSVETTIRLFHEHGGEVDFRGRFAAVTDPEALTSNVLGREITNLFAVIVDHPGDLVCLIGQRHRYSIQQV